jgi:pyruvate/2-oxoacid:ferredoxin oxidoreductase alpha subunit
MIPNMFKIAAELTPFVMHVSARTVAAVKRALHEASGVTLAACRLFSESLD